MKKKSTKLHLMLMLVCLLAVTTLKAQTVLSTNQCLLFKFDGYNESKP
jgi:hypothetical protein